MVTLDTLKIQIPNQLVHGFSEKIMLETQKRDFLGDEVEVFLTAKKEFLPSGVSSLQYKQGGDWQVTMSAKTLKDNYLQGISINTYPQMINTLNQVLHVNPSELWDSNPKVLLCDTTNNINLDKLGGTQMEVCTALLSSKANYRFENHFYHSTKKLGVEFRGTQDEKNRLICYSKNLDLLKPANRKFMLSVKKGDALIEMASKQIRLEVNHTTFESMRGRFGIKQPNLQEILQSTKPVNHDFLIKITQPNKQLDIFNDIQNSGLSGWEYIQLKGVEWIIKECGGDFVKVREVFKVLLGKSFKYYYNGRKQKKGISIKELIKKLNIQQTGEIKYMVNQITQNMLAELLVA